MAAPAFSIPNPTAARLADPALREALQTYARRRLSPGEVEDLVQNTLTEALTSSNAPLDEGDFRRWLHGIARHKIADSYRRRGRLPVPIADVDAKAADAAACPGELLQWIERELPETEGARATLLWLLRESDGETLDEIARELALPAPRVRQRVSRLRRHFHARWLALGAMGLILLLVAGLVLHRARELPVSPIARESAVPFDSAAPQASSPTAPTVSAPAGKAGSEQHDVPKRFTPQKARPRDVPSKAIPKKSPRPRKQQPPSKKGLPSKGDLPSKPPASNDNQLGVQKRSPQFSGAKNRD